MISLRDTEGRSQKPEEYGRVGVSSREFATQREQNSRFDGHNRLIRFRIMTSKPRNRVVVFRLSQEEYRMLTEACERAGGRNLSDFTRSELLECLQLDAVGHLRERFASLEDRIAGLQSQINRLAQGVLNADPSRP